MRFLSLHVLEGVVRLLWGVLSASVLPAAKLHLDRVVDFGARADNVHGCVRRHLNMQPVRGRVRENGSHLPLRAAMRVPRPERIDPVPGTKGEDENAEGGREKRYTDDGVKKAPLQFRGR